VDVESHLEQIEALLAEARPVPLSTLVMVHRDDVEGILDEVRAALPEELREARWLLREREDVLAAATREAEQIRAEAEADAERLRSQTEVLRTARREADRVLEEARGDARQLRREAEDYVDGRLAEFEDVLERTLETVGRGRQRLQEGFGPPELADGDVVDLRAEPPVGRAAQVYDQERSR
jgi:chromosome segregation ATPase